MIHECHLVRYDLGILGVIFRKNAEECAAVLGLDLCFERDCGDWCGDQPHSHIPDRIFGPPQLYSSQDVQRAGLHYREGRLPWIGPVRWELYHENDPRRVIFFEPKPLII